MYFCVIDGFVVGTGGGRCRFCHRVLCNQHWHAVLPADSTNRERAAFQAASGAPQGAVCSDCRGQLGRKAVNALPPVIVPTDPLELMAYGMTDPDARLHELLPSDLRPLMRRLVPFVRNEMQQMSRLPATGNYPELFDSTKPFFRGLVLRSFYRDYKSVSAGRDGLTHDVGIGPMLYEIAAEDGLVYECVGAKRSWKFGPSRVPTPEDVWKSVHWIPPESWYRLLPRP